MHPASMNKMTEMLKRYPGKDARVLDVGSFDVNGSYRNLVESKGWSYLGLDIAPGKNVDIVSIDPYHFPFDDNRFDLVISGSAMEHVEAIWLWIPELVRVLRKGGMLAINTHTQWAYHPHPVDCWRILPDGMKFLFDQTGQLEDYQIGMHSKTDIAATAWKVK